MALNKVHCDQDENITSIYISLHCPYLKKCLSSHWQGSDALWLNFEQAWIVLQYESPILAVRILFSYTEYLARPWFLPSVEVASQNLSYIRIRLNIIQVEMEAVTALTSSASMHRAGRHWEELRTDFHILPLLYASRTHLSWILGYESPVPITHTHPSPPPPPPPSISLLLCQDREIYFPVV